jgi:hypothetical protein
MLIKGPGISVGKVLPIVSSMADIAPTLLELVGDKKDPGVDAVHGLMDGTSFAPLLLAGVATEPVETTDETGAGVAVVRHLYSPGAEGQNTAAVVEGTTARARELGFAR